MQRHLRDRAGLLGLNILTHEKDQPSLEQDSSERQMCSFSRDGEDGLFVEFNNCSFGFPLDSHKGENTVSSPSDRCIFLSFFC